MKFTKGPYKFLTFHPVFQDKNIYGMIIPRIKKIHHRAVYDNIVRVYEMSLTDPDNMTPTDKILYNNIIKILFLIILNA